ncbi:MAG: rod shape-determining protein MreC [Patescibacteria group bacterium]
MKKILTHPFILSLLIIASLIFLNSQSWLNPVKDAFYYLSKPGQAVFYFSSQRINNLFEFIGSINQLADENNQLKREKENLLSKLAQLNETEKENEFLREQIGLVQSEPGQLILARAIGLETSGLRRYLLINQGSQQGVKEKAAVIKSGNFLIGQVKEVSDSLSKVQLITDIDSRVNALIQETRVAGLVRGDKDYDLLIDLLPQGEKIEKEQIVVTSSLAGLFPPGLIIGQIQRIISSDVQIAQMAKIKPAIDFEKLDWVFVIKVAP